MRLYLHRMIPSPEGCTIGELWVHGETDRLCWTLEDPVREIQGEPVALWKRKGKTAIPYGTYRVRITYSNRFDRLLPLLENVPGFSGIRIHNGNTSADTEGCILVGFRHEPGQAFVGESRSALAAVQGRIEEALLYGEEVTIEIKRTPEA